MADPQALPFNLNIQALPTGSYRVTTTDAPGGSASVEVPTPFSFGDLAQLSAVVDGRAGLSAPDQAARLETFGTTLFNAVISGPVAEAYQAKRTQAGAGAINLRVQLDQAGLLRGVPWNLIRDPAGGKLTVTPPKWTYNVRAIGGLREVVLRPNILVPLFVVLIVLIGGGIGGVLAAINASRTNVDLVVTSLHFFPPKPVPGQIISVSLTIKNIGTSDAGKFNWYWFENPITSQTTPDMQGQVPGLGAGTSVTVKGDIIFGWWGLYQTTAHVNPDFLVRELNYDNNYNSAAITTLNNPFVIDWTIFPDTSLITSEKDLKGDEFNDWGLTITPQATSLTNPDPTCASAVAKIQVSADNLGDQFNRLTTGLPSANLSSSLRVTSAPTPVPGSSLPCDSIPVLFNLSHAIGSVEIDYSSARGGDYVLTMTDSAGTPLGKATQTVKAGSTNNKLVVALDNGATIPTAVQILFSGSGGIQIDGMTLTKATSP